VPTLFAGPNGSGKSTLIKQNDFEGKDRLLDADAIARDLSPSNPAAAAIEAGRRLLARVSEYLDQLVSFAIEMTLASRGHRELIRKAKDRGFKVHLAFCCLEDSEMSITRVYARVAKGGHFIPEDDVRRRYTRSIENCREAIRLVDIAKVYDNSKNGHRLVRLARDGEIVWRADPLPGWLKI